MKEQFLEKKYSTAKKIGGLKFFKFLLILAFVLFGLYTLVDYLVNNLKYEYGIEYGIICGVMLCLILFTFTENMKSNYYLLA